MSLPEFALYPAHGNSYFPTGEVSDPGPEVRGAEHPGCPGHRWYKLSARWPDHARCTYCGRHFPRSIVAATSGVR